MIAGSVAARNWVALCPPVAISGKRKRIRILSPQNIDPRTRPRLIRVHFKDGAPSFNPSGSASLPNVRASEKNCPDKTAHAANGGRNQTSGIAARTRAYAVHAPR
ncbi:MAG: hypothetical protein EBU49_06075 [Proteobacteria bacterium]|nr:hypothetical protein [Pseudomonadota bacterium]